MPGHSVYSGSALAGEGLWVGGPFAAASPLLLNSVLVRMAGTSPEMGTC